MLRGDGTAKGRGILRPARLAAMVMPALLAMLLLAPASASALNGTIQGKVTALKGGAAVVGYNVCAYSKAGGEGYCDATGPAGEYSVEAPAGEYGVRFTDVKCSKGKCVEGPYLEQFFNAKPTEAEEEAVTVTAGVATKGINAAMIKGGVITGKVTEKGTGRELEPVKVCADMFYFFQRCGYSGETGEGTYHIEGLPEGEYTVAFTGGTVCPPLEEECTRINLVSRFYKEATSFLNATHLTIGSTEGELHNEINAVMEQGAEIGGRVTAAAGGAPLKGIEVCPGYESGAAPAECVNTDSEGNYLLEGLKGEYFIAFYGDGNTLAGQFYGGTTEPSAATRLTATPPEVITGINESMVAGGTISGLVTVASTGAPVGGVEVCARNGYFTRCENSNAKGEYAISGVLGAYKVEFYGNESCEGSCHSLPYVDEFYNGVYEAGEAENLVVASGAKVTGIDARLPTSVKQGREETAARKHAEEVARLEASKAAGEAAQKHAEEVKRAEEAARKHAAEVAAKASVKLVRIKATASGLLVTLKVAGKDSVTVSGPGLKRTVAKLTAGTHVVKVRFTTVGRIARARHKRLKVTVDVKVGAIVVTLGRTLKL